VDNEKLLTYWHLSYGDKFGPRCPPVELGHLLKNKRMVLVLLPMLLYIFTNITNCNLRLVSGSENEKSSLAMVSEAVMMNDSLVKFMGKGIPSLSNRLKTSLARILCQGSGSYDRHLFLEEAVE
jgi:hypothetical protein